MSRSYSMPSLAKILSVSVPCLVRHRFSNFIHVAGYQHAFTNKQEALSHSIESSSTHSLFSSPPMPLLILTCTVCRNSLNHSPCRRRCRLMARQPMIPSLAHHVIIFWSSRRRGPRDCPQRRRRTRLGSARGQHDGTQSWLVLLRAVLRYHLRVSRGERSSHNSYLSGE